MVSALRRQVLRSCIDTDMTRFIADGLPDLFRRISTRIRLLPPSPRYGPHFIGRPRVREYFLEGLDSATSDSGQFPSRDRSFNCDPSHRRWNIFKMFFTDWSLILFSYIITRSLFWLPRSLPPAQSWFALSSSMHDSLFYRVPWVGTARIIRE